MALAVLCIVGPVLADPDDPDSLSVLDAIAVRDLLEEDDLFVAVHYLILYDPTAEPADTAEELFLVRLMDGAAELGVVRPYPYYNNGYDQGIAGLYFSAAEALVWETAYTITIQGTPAAWATPPSTSFILGPSSYSGLDGQTGNRQALYEWMVDAVESLESNWAVTLLETSEAGSILDETGQTYLTAAIPGLAALCPQLLWIGSAEMDTTARTWGTGQADAYAARFDGTWVGDGMESVADLLHCEPTLIGGFIFVLLPFLAVIVMAEKWFNTSTPALLCLPLLLAMGALLGFLPLAVFALVVISFVLFLGYVLFFRTS